MGQVDLSTGSMFEINEIQRFNQLVSRENMHIASFRGIERGGEKRTVGEHAINKGFPNLISLGETCDEPC